MSERKANDSGIVYWLKILAAVGIPLALVYLAVAGLVNPQFAEIRDALSEIRDDISENRNAISANREAINSNREAINSNRAAFTAKFARLEARIDLMVEVIVLAFTNENVTEADLRNLLSAGVE